MIHLIAKLVLRLHVVLLCLFPFPVSGATTNASTSVSIRATNCLLGRKWANGLHIYNDIDSPCCLPWCRHLPRYRESYPNWMMKITISKASPKTGETKQMVTMDNGYPQLWGSLYTITILSREKNADGTQQLPLLLLQHPHHPQRHHPHPGTPVPPGRVRRTPAAGPRRQSDPRLPA